MSDIKAKLRDGFLILAAVAVASFVVICLLLMTGVFNPNTVNIEALKPDNVQTKSPAEGPGVLSRTLTSVEPPNEHR